MTLFFGFFCDPLSPFRVFFCTKFQFKKKRSLMGCHIYLKNYGPKIVTFWKIPLRCAKNPGKNNFLEIEPKFWIFREKSEECCRSFG